MKQIKDFLDGVSLEISEDGFFVLSKNGNKTFFDNAGEFIISESRRYLDEKAKPEWMRYFVTIASNEREQVSKWLYTIKPKGQAQKKYIQIVRDAVDKIHYDYKLSTIETSIDNEGHLFFKEYKPVAVGLTCEEWENKAKEFSKEYNSQLATLEELYLWYALRIIQGKWSLEDVAENTSQEGNYWFAPFSSHELEPSGIKKVGGARDGIGNTFKIVKANDGFALCGGSFEYASAYYPIADFEVYKDVKSYAEYGTGVIVLRV